MGRSNIRAAFARRIDGPIAHVSDVSRGLKCDCRCLHCDGLMIAKKGEIMAHHFAHHGPDCGGAMTWLHRTAQEILVQQRSICLPENRYGSKGGRLEFSEIQTEVSVGNRRIDCVGVTNDGNEIAIEIRVTHEVDEAKLSDLREANKAAVEVDLRELSSMLPDWNMLRNAVCESPDYIKWLHDPLALERELTAIAAYKDHLRHLIHKHNIGPYSENYDVGAAECWNCSEATPVFTWASNEYESRIISLPELDPDPPEPRPRTIIWSNSKTAQTSYWGDRCASCDALQGQFFLFTNMLEYLVEWFEMHGDGVGYHDLENHYQGSLYFSGV